MLFQVGGTQIPRPIKALQHLRYHSLKKTDPTIELGSIRDEVD